MSEFERKPDGGLNAWIETYEAMGGDETDAEMLCLLLELRRRRENQAEIERERDELLQRMSNAKIEREEEKRLHEEGAFMLCGQYDDLAAAMGWSSKLAEKQGVSQLEYARQLNSRVIDLEAEIARRDAAAGEAVAWQYRYNDGKVGDWKTVDSESECNHSPCYERRPIYTAAQPAVLPELEQDVKNIIGLLSGNEWAEHCTKSELGRKLENEITELHNTYSRAHAVLPPDITFESKGFLSLTSEDFAYNRALEDVRKLGAQQQKVVELPAPEKDGGTDWQGDITAGCVNRMRDRIITALDSAGVKWELKK